MPEDVINVSFCHDGIVDRLRDLDGIALGIFEDERPLKGITGFADWRLHGLLSRLVLRKQLSGSLFENCLVPSDGRLPMEKVFLFGLGALNEFKVDTYRQVAAEIVSTMSGACVSHFALSLWDVTRGRVAPEEAAGIFFRQIVADCEHRPQAEGGRKVTFVETGPWGHALRDGFLKLSERSQELPVRLELR